MKIGLTGATGFLGRSISKHMFAAGHQVVAWRRPDTERPLWESPNDPTNPSAIRWIEGRLGDRDAADQLAAESDVIIHAGLKRSGASFVDAPDDPVEYFQSNVIGSLQLIEAAAAAKVQKFVFVSSGTVHDRILPGDSIDETHPLWPSSLYGAYKASVETIVHAYGFSGKLNVCTLRPTAIYGVADPVESSKWYAIIRDIVAGRSVDASGGSKSVHVDDVATAIDTLIQTDETVAGETFLCSDRLISTHEVATIARRLSGSDSAITGTAKQSKHEIDTAKIRRLGVTFSGTSLLESTIQQLVDHIRLGTSR
ncbi:UDP-glucose 4-epimerase [Rubripirellula lacrimiformis]|uniref:UDP-glucose 4-epimerase n=1 Tax=Rubripirellula lacrimiformis TaxID=1930273 RepID=A0A517N675_9BACT|nr:NAD(P)-dependent oxidoreductase [Rubripirellula lacrimiformis]QDT02633.1 UDP-glucose 4-epimerase [Rubripirellula lacrimiformis]